MYCKSSFLSSSFKKTPFLDQDASRGIKHRKIVNQSLKCKQQCSASSIAVHYLMKVFSHLCERLKRVQFIPVFLLVAVSKRLNGGQFLTDHVYYDCKQRYWLITKLCSLFSISNI